MSYFIASISNSGGAPEQAYRKMQAAGACPEKPFAGKLAKAEYIVCFSTILSVYLNLQLSSLPEMFKFEVPSLTVGTLDTLMVGSRLRD